MLQSRKIDLPSDCKTLQDQKRDPFLGLGRGGEGGGGGKICPNYLIAVCLYLADNGRFDRHGQTTVYCSYSSLSVSIVATILADNGRFDHHGQTTV